MSNIINLPPQNNGEPHRAEVQVFLSELTRLCQAHRLSISHEDEHGGFRIMPYEEGLMKWLQEAREEGLK